MHFLGVNTTCSAQRERMNSACLLSVFHSKALESCLLACMSVAWLGFIWMNPDKSKQQKSSLFWNLRWRWTHSCSTLVVACSMTSAAKFTPSRSLDVQLIVSQQRIIASSWLWVLTESLTRSGPLPMISALWATLPVRVPTMKHMSCKKKLIYELVISPRYHII